MTGSLVQFIHLSIAYIQHQDSKVLHFLLFPPVFFSSILYGPPPAPFLAIITTGTPRCFITTISELSAGLLIIAIQSPPTNPLHILSFHPPPHPPSRSLCLCYSVTLQSP